ncbi:MAG: protein-L-isoaspartate(D-aspartate) O-methyltransferase [candidate division WOR-3 bacterium]|nr:MAG: protein-L-isoaspartate(D-aspartate) O-methyltransferase [candidate division WOR-3 bacterium]
MHLTKCRLSFLLSLTILVIAVEGCAAKDNRDNRPWDVVAREVMVDRQIKARGITDKGVIAAMLKVERHRFVPSALERLAYGDHPLPIGEEQTISQPYIVALMTERLKLKSTDRVFEVGTGSGYQAAILSLLVSEVYTVEIIESLADSAAARLDRLGFRNVYVRCGDGFLGWPEKAPFDAIIITCAPPKLPDPLVAQLAEGGRLIVPLGDDFQVLTIYEKTGDVLKKEEIAPVLFVPMKGIIEQ